MGVIGIFEGMSKNFRVCRYPFYKLKSYKQTNCPRSIYYTLLANESALDDLKDAAMFSDKGVQMKRLILSFERLYENERLKCLKQRDITDFFTPV